MNKGKEVVDIFNELQRLRYMLNVNPESISVRNGFSEALRRLCITIGINPDKDNDKVDALFADTFDVLTGSSTLKTFADKYL